MSSAQRLGEPFAAFAKEFWSVDQVRFNPPLTADEIEALVLRVNKGVTVTLTMLLVSQTRMSATPLKLLISAIQSSARGFIIFDCEVGLRVTRGMIDIDSGEGFIGIADVPMV